ncbi:hypothetical protein RUND412_004930 [Rhizina undulata]
MVSDSTRGSHRSRRGCFFSNGPDETTAEGDETSPLLAGSIKKAPLKEVDAEDKATASFPTGQLFVLGVVRIIEPITFASLIPYIYAQTIWLLSDPSKPDSPPADSKIALYSALLISSFAFSETVTSHVWGRLSDTYGRKPIVLIGLFGSALSLILYGFSTSVPMAMTARIVGGFLNGNMGVLQTMVMELTGARDDWKAKGLNVLPFTWCLGSIIGPIIGGGLAMDSGISRGTALTIWEKYPFALPNLFCAFISFFGMLIGWLVLKETNERVLEQGKVDCGLVTGSWLLTVTKAFGQRIFGWDMNPTPDATADDHESLSGATPVDSDDEFDSSETSTLAGSRPATLYQTVSTCTHDMVITQEDIESRFPSTPMESIYTPQFILLMFTYFLLYYHTNAFEHLIAIFLQSNLPPLFGSPDTTSSSGLQILAENYQSLVAAANSGFGFTTGKMGILFLVQGTFQMSLQFVVFPYLMRYFKPSRIYVTSLCFYPLLYFFAPFLVLLQPSSFTFYLALGLLLVLKIALEIVAFPSLFLVVHTFAERSPSGMGAVYGLGAGIAGIAKGVGPIVTGLMWKLGDKWGCVGISWWFLSFISMAAIGMSVGLSTEPDQPREKEESHFKRKKFIEA